MTTYAVVENKIITEIHNSLPIVWKNVSGFNHIGDDVDILKTYGWYIVNTITPEYDPETQQIGDLGEPIYNSKKDTVTATYNIVDIFIESPIELQRRFMILVRDTRDYLISQTDWTMLADVVENKSVDWVNSWKQYRQSLRDFPDQFVFLETDLPPDFNTLIWPSKPTGQ